MSNELAVTTEQELALLASLDLGIGGAENLHDGDVGMPPRLRISQPNRPIQIDGLDTPGVIVNTLTGDAWEKLPMVVLMYLPRTFVMWPDKFSSDNEPLCKSNTGNGSTGGTDPQPDPCGNCPMSQFINNEKPKCSMQRNFLVWLIESEEVAILTLSSTALRVARKLTSLAQQSGLKKSIIFGLRLNDEPTGKWYTPEFKAGEKLSVPQIIALAEARDEMKNLVISADDEPAPPARNQNIKDTPDEDMPF